MMDPTWTDIVTAVAAGITAIGVPALGIGAAAAAYQLRWARRTAAANLLMELARRWDNETTLIAARTAAQQYDNEDDLWAVVSALADNSAERRNLLEIPNFFALVGIQVKEDAISPALVGQFFAGDVRQWWKLYRRTVQEISNKSALPTGYERFEYLHDRLA